MKKVTFLCISILTIASIGSQVSGQTVKSHVDINNNNSQKIVRATTVVNSFEELKSALENDNGITDITLGSDITLSSGIKINPSKTAISINGDNHTLTEIRTGITGTIYISDTNGTTDVTLKNINFDGKNYYGPINIDDSVYGVTLNYENISYRGPQLVHNIHGFANFSGTNKIDIVTNGTDSDPGQEIFEGLGVTISGNFTATHEGQLDSAFWFGLGNDERPFLNIKDNATVTIDILSNTMFYVDNSDTHPLDITIGNAAQFDIKTNRELFRLGHAGNVNLLDNSNTTITRNSNMSTEASVSLDNSNFKVEPTASLNIVHSPETQASIFKARNNSLIDFDTAKDIDLKTNATSRVFDAQNTKFNVNTSTLEAWHASDDTNPTYENNTPLKAELQFGITDVSLITSNQLDILSHWDIINTNRLKLSGEDTTAPGKPVLNDDLTDKSTSFIGTAEPGSTVAIYSENGTQITTGIADKDGNFNIVIPEGTNLVAGDKYYATSTDSSGNISDPSDLVTVKDITAPDKPILNALTTTSTEFTGKSEPGSKVEIFTGSVAGPVATGTTDSNGNFNIPVPNGTVLVVGVEYYARATDASGNISDPSDFVNVTQAK